MLVSSALPAMYTTLVFILAQLTDKKLYLLFVDAMLEFSCHSTVCLLAFFRGVWQTQVLIVIFNYMGPALLFTSNDGDQE